MIKLQLDNNRMKKLTHIDKDGNAKMVDVADKTDQLRIAKAYGRIEISKDTVKLISENNIKKGDVLTVAKIAGIQAAKLTSHLIPLCHPLQLHKVDICLTLEQNSVVAQSEVRCIGKTGVEMEALTAVNIALLTVYDMCKAVDKNMKICEVFLQDKQKHDIERGYIVRG